MKDIRAGLAYLHTRPEIDANRLALLGRSEGAIDAPMVALDEPAILILTGETDRQADPTQVDDWMAAFKQAGNHDVTAGCFPG